MEHAVRLGRRGVVAHGFLLLFDHVVELLGLASQSGLRGLDPTQACRDRRRDARASRWPSGTHRLRRWWRGGMPFEPLLGHAPKLARIEIERAVVEERMAGRRILPAVDPVHADRAHVADALQQVGRRRGSGIADDGVGEVERALRDVGPGGAATGAKRGVGAAPHGQIEEPRQTRRGRQPVERRQHLLRGEAFATRGSLRTGWRRRSEVCADVPGRLPFQAGSVSWRGHARAAIRSTCVILCTMGAKPSSEEGGRDARSSEVRSSPPAFPSPATCPKPPPLVEARLAPGPLAVPAAAEALPGPTERSPVPAPSPRPSRGEPISTPTTTSSSRPRRPCRTARIGCARRASTSSPGRAARKTVERGTLTCGAEQVVEYRGSASGIRYNAAPLLTCTMALGLARFERVLQEEAETPAPIACEAHRACRDVQLPSHGPLPRLGQRTQLRERNRPSQHDARQRQDDRRPKDFGPLDSEPSAPESQFLRRSARRAYDEHLFRRAHAVLRCAPPRPFPPRHGALPSRRDR